jgi:3-methyl-2-oxobutanoate hydroxymethyltransferase
MIRGVKEKNMPSTHSQIRLPELLAMKAAGRKIAMLTAYDYPTAQAAQHAGVHMLLVGDSMGCVLLGHPNTRRVPLELMIILAEAVRRGAPDVCLVGDMPFEAMKAGAAGVLAAAGRFRDEAGCDAIKVEAQTGDAALVARLAQSGFETIAHLGLRPQSIDAPENYRAQARDAETLAALVSDAQEMVAAGAAMLLLEAVPNEASSAVVQAVNVPVIGCGAGPACHGHVVVTQDLLGMSGIRPPRFVPVLADLGAQTEAALRRYVASIRDGSYPAPQHVYPMRAAPVGPASA